MLKAMGSEVRTGKYYNKAGKVALHIKGKSNYHFDYSKGKKSGHAEHSKYGKMTSGLKHQSEFQKQAGKSKGKVVKIKAGTHAEKRRDKKGKVVTRHVSNKPKVKGTKQAAGSKVNGANNKADKQREMDLTKLSHSELIAEIEASHQADVDANGGYKVEQYGHNIDPKKPSAIVGVQKFNRLYQHTISPADKIKHIHEHYEPSEMEKIGKQHNVPYPKTEAEHAEYLDGAGVHVMNLRGGKMRSEFDKPAIDSAISGAQTVIDKPGIKIKGMNRNLTKDYAKKPKKIDSTSKKAKQLMKDREGKGVIGTPKK